MLSILISAPLALAGCPASLPSLTGLEPIHSPERARGDFEDALQVLNQDMLGGLEEHAKWCQKNKAYLERNRTWERILEIDPEHKEARKALGYRLDRKTKEWERKSSYREPKASKPQVALEAAERLKALDEKHLARQMRLLKPEAGGSPKQRAQLLDTLILRLPDNEELRGLNGQVRVEDKDGTRWVMVESQRAIARRKELRARRKQLMADWPKPESNDGPTEDDSFDIEWPQDYSTDRVRVLGFSSDSEAQRALQVCHILWDYTRDTFDHELEGGYTVHLVGRSEARKALFDGLSDGDEERLKSLKSIAGQSSGRGDFQWGTNSDQRVDGSCRQGLARLLNRRFGTSSKQGWVSEGFGMYLTDQLLHTRMTFFVRTTDYVEGGDRKLGRQMHSPDANWLKLAKNSLGGKKKPNLSFTLGRTVNDLTPTDLVVAYSLAAFLMEGHEPAMVVKILERVGKGDNSTTVLEEELGYDLFVLRQRLHDWIAEVLS